MLVISQRHNVSSSHHLWKVISGIYKLLYKVKWRDKLTYLAKLGVVSAGNDSCMLKQAVRGSSL